MAQAPRHYLIFETAGGFLRHQLGSALRLQRRTDPERRRATIAQIPLGRMGQPEDIVGAILFLASVESRWVTTVTVDGGYLVQ
jgi:NAD(P)-dependent dehydrogenase (short-subunit alcohol dehydrogenase family)